jgi:ketosteroid isomerase-like protein
MSQENVEVVREAADAANRRDPDAFVALLSPDVEWEENPVMPGLREIYRGRAEVRRWFEEAILELWTSVHIAVEEITELSDERLFVGGVLTARGKGSGVPAELRVWSVFWFANAKITRRQVFWTRDEALEAAGLRE